METGDFKKWEDSRKDSYGWAYESELGIRMMKALNSLAYELHLKRKEGYKQFFKETTDKIKELLNE